MLAICIGIPEECQDHVPTVRHSFACFNVYLL